MAWNPTARAVPVVRELECSRDDDGVAQGTITVEPFNAGKRLAYENGAMDAVRLDVNEAGVTMRRLMPAELNILHARLCIVDCTGFPDQEDPATGTRVPFSFAKREHIEALTEDVWLEVVSHLEAIAPKPTQEVRKPADRKAPAKPAPAGASGSELDEDPTTTSSTQGAGRRSSRGRSATSTPA
jgi:hypothetical protein